jgi:hypothetical protein
VGQKSDLTGADWVSGCQSSETAGATRGDARRTLLNKATRRGRSPSLTAMNLRLTPRPGFTCQHYSIGPDLSLLDQKFKLCHCSNDPWFSRLDEQTARAQITAATRDWYESSVPYRRAKILRRRSFPGLPDPKCLGQCRSCLRDFLQADHFPRSIFQLPAIHGRRYCLLTSFAMQDNLPDGELLASPQS